MKASDTASLAISGAPVHAVKARQSPFLGLWWRWNARMSGLGGGKQIIVLVGSYLAFRVLDFALGDLGRPDAAAAGHWISRPPCSHFGAISTL